MMTTINLTPDVYLLKEEGVLIVQSKKQLRSIKLEPQLVAILWVLFQHKNQLVRKETLIEEVWADNPLVGQTALRRNIYKLRQLLKKHDLVETINIATIAKKGYKLNLAATTVITSFHLFLVKAALVLMLISFLFLRVVTEEDVILIVDNSTVSGL